MQSLGINMFSGAVSGILGAALGSPFFLVKTRLSVLPSKAVLPMPSSADCYRQSYSPFLPVGTQHNYRNAADGLRQVYSHEGLRGLWRGIGAATIRTGFGSSVQLPTYFFAKRRLMKHLNMKEGLPLHLASSTVSGFVVCCVMHPPGQSYDAVIHIQAHLLQILSCHECTIKQATCTKACSIAFLKPSRLKVSSQYTKALMPTCLGFSPTL